MKAMMLTGIRQIEMKEVPDPIIAGPKDVKIKMKVLGICGSDVHYYTQGKIGSQEVMKVQEWLLKPGLLSKKSRKAI
jgi:threonine dehydrogenase-like Zn-dependent dehydrogenase